MDEHEDFPALEPNASSEEQLAVPEKQFTLRDLSFLAGCLLLMAALVTFGLEIWHWLKVGEWNTIPAIVLFAPFASYPPSWLIAFESWLLNPEGWVGLAKLCNWWLDSPLSWTLCAVGGLIIFWLPTLFE